MKTSSVKHLFAGVATLCGLGAFAVGAVPQVTNVSMSQSLDRTVTVTYDLEDADAVVTVDFETNVVGTTQWVSIGGANISGGPVENGQPTGDVWKKVAKGNGRRIVWNPDHTWCGHKVAAHGIRAKVKAYALDDTPDYMIVSLVKNASQRQTYYPAESFIPGGVSTNNEAIRTSAIVMRKIKAKGVTWLMGPNGSDQHDVTLANNFYIGIFEITQGQYQEVWGSNPSGFHGGKRLLRPVEKTYYNIIRRGTTSSDVQSDYPNPPYTGSFLGKLRSLTDGIDFDLPSEAEWEYACRAGHANGYWGDGASSTETALKLIARFSTNNGMTDTGGWPNLGCNESLGTAIVGTYQPNSWGLYDMHGNVMEWCLDFYGPITGKDASGNPYNGRVNALDGTHLLDGTLVDANAGRVLKGGGYYQTYDNLYSYKRVSKAANATDTFYGFRVVCRAGLK